MAMLVTTKDTADAELERTLKATIADAGREFAPLQFQGSYPINGFGVGELMPRQVGIPNDFWQMTVTTSYANWINRNLSTDEYIIVTGIFNLTPDPSTTLIEPAANGVTLPIISIESLYATDVVRGWFSQPFVTRPSNNLTIAAIGRVAQTEQLGLLGHTVAKKSFLIDRAP